MNKLMIWGLMILLLCVGVFGGATINIESPATDTWWTVSNNLSIYFNVTGDNSTYSCALYWQNPAGTFESWDTTASAGNSTNLSVVNKTSTHFFATPVTARTNSTKWGVMCNDTKTYSFWSENSTLTGIDLTNPSPFHCSGLLGHDYVNGTGTSDHWTDFTPTFVWNASLDSNFSHYRIWVGDNKYAAGYEYNLSATNNASLTSALLKTVTLLNNTADSTITWWMSAYDLAGNTVTAENCTSSADTLTYYTDETCSKLYTGGWNLCALRRTSFPTAKSLCQETNCAYISMYNATHHFQTYTNGSVTNENMTFDGPARAYNSTVFIYVNANQSWENETWGGPLSLTYTLTNGSDAKGSGWNLVPMANRTCATTIGDIDRSMSGNDTTYLAIPGNVTYIVWHNNSINTNVPFVTNWTINTAIVPQYGEAIWAYLNNDTALSSWAWSMSGEGC